MLLLSATVTVCLVLAFAAVVVFQGVEGAQLCATSGFTDPSCVAQTSPPSTQHASSVSDEDDPMHCPQCTLPLPAAPSTLSTWLSSINSLNSKPSGVAALNHAPPTPLQALFVATGPRDRVLSGLALALHLRQHMPWLRTTHFVQPASVKLQDETDHLAFHFVELHRHHWISADRSLDSSSAATSTPESDKILGSLQETHPLCLPSLVKRSNVVFYVTANAKLSPVDVAFLNYLGTVQPPLKVFQVAPHCPAPAATSSATTPAIPILVASSGVFAPSTNADCIYTGMLPLEDVLTPDQLINDIFAAVVETAKNQDKRQVILIDLVHRDFATVGVHRRLCAFVEQLSDRFRFLWRQTAPALRPAGLRRGDECLNHVRFFSPQEMPNVEHVPGEPKIDLILHTGGAVMTQAALLAGIPSVVLTSAVTEKHPVHRFYVDAMERMDIGVQILPDADVEEMAETIRWVLASPKLYRSIEEKKQEMLQELHEDSLTQTLTKLLLDSPVQKEAAQTLLAEDVLERGPLPNMCLRFDQRFLIRSDNGRYCRMNEKFLLFSPRLQCDLQETAQATQFFFMRPNWNGLYGTLNPRKFSIVETRQNLVLGYQYRANKVRYVVPTWMRHRGYRSKKTMRFLRSLRAVQVLHPGPQQSACVKVFDLLKFRFRFQYLQIGEGFYADVASLKTAALYGRSTLFQVVPVEMQWKGERI